MYDTYSQPGPNQDPTIVSDGTNVFSLDGQINFTTGTINPIVGVCLRNGNIWVLEDTTTAAEIAEFTTAGVEQNRTALINFGVGIVPTAIEYDPTTDLILIAGGDIGGTVGNAEIHVSVFRPATLQEFDETQFVTRDSATQGAVNNNYSFAILDSGDVFFMGSHDDRESWAVYECTNAVFGNFSIGNPGSFIFEIQGEQYLAASATPDGTGIRVNIGGNWFDYEQDGTPRGAVNSPAEPNAATSWEPLALTPGPSVTIVQPFVRVFNSDGTYKDINVSNGQDYTPQGAGSPATGAGSQTYDPILIRTDNPGVIPDGMKKWKIENVGSVAGAVDLANLTLLPNEYVEFEAYYDHALGVYVRPNGIAYDPTNTEFKIEITP